MSSHPSINRPERMAQIIALGALGDALGYLIEFQSIDQIEAQYGVLGPAPPFQGNDLALVSDDTQMTLFTLEALYAVRGPNSAQCLLEACTSAYHDWHQTQAFSFWQAAQLQWGGALAPQFECLWKRRAPGMTCLSAFAAPVLGSRTLRLNNSKGCGTVMRSAPFGFAPTLLELSLTDALLAAEEASYLTHGHDEAAISSRALAHFVHLGLTGLDFSTAVHQVSADLQHHWPASNTLRLIESALILPNHFDSRSMVKRLGQGWVGDEALALAVHCTARCYLQGLDPLTALRESAAHSGDSDSTASLCGQLLASFGSIPEQTAQWAAQLDVFPALLELFAQLPSSWLSARPPVAKPPAVERRKTNWLQFLRTFCS